MEVAAPVLHRFHTHMASVRAAAGPSPWELAAEMIAVKIRWFGLLVGYVLVNVDSKDRHSTRLCARWRSTAASHRLVSLGLA